MPPKYTKRTQKNATNISYKKKKRPEDRKTAVVSKSFQKAYQQMQPSKEYRVNVSDLSMDTTTLNNFIHSVTLANIVQGTGIDERLRNTIYASWLHIKGTIQSNTTAKTKMLRIMVIQEKAVESGIDFSGWTNLYLLQDFNTVAPTGTQSDGRRTLNKQLINVFYDRVHRLKPEDESAYVLNLKIKIGRVLAYFKGAPTNSLPINGNIRIVYNLFDADNPVTPPSNTVVVSAESRLFFKDYNKMSYRD